jgi:nucleoside-diphosphate-sugar epimerase
MNILITGHTGFIGRHLTPTLIAQNHTIIGISRHPDPTLSDPQLHQIQIPSLDTYPDWHQTLTGIDTIVHLAAKAHILQDTALDPTTSSKFPKHKSIDI